MKNNSMGAIQFCLLILVVVSTESTESVKFSVRLVNGTKRSGMVEQLLGSTWKSLCGGVCWTAENARVTCKELGFQGGSRPSEDRGIIGDDTPGRYKCQGNENVLRNCYQISSCSPTQCKYGAQVICQDAVRLIDHEPFGNKRIEFFKQNSKKKWKWGGLCSKCWTGTNSNVVCHQYGLRSGEVKETETIKKNQNIWHHVQFNCSGDEKHLSDCPRSNQECQNCGNDEAIINCIQKEPSYNEKCDNKTGCKNGLICKDNVCKCGDDTTSFWNVDQMKCTQKPSYNEKCDNKTGCKNGLICKDNVCKCGDDTTSFWNVDQMKCTQKHSYNAKCDNKTVCKNGLICKDNVCKCGDESTSFWNDDQMICTKKLDFNETCTNRTECMRGLICAVNNVCRCENETTSYWNTDKNTCTERSSLGENCTLYMFASCKDTLECKEDDILGAVCRKKNEDVSSGKIDGDRENQVLWPIFVGVSIAVLFIILIVAVVVRWFKKKRRNASKYEQDVSYHHRQPLDYSEPVLNLSDENLNENQENNASEDGLYSLAQSNIIVSVPAPTTTKMTKTDEYGYGVLGGRILENDDDGLYSHSKQWTNTGEYDMFVRKDSDTDVNNLYDHTRGIQQENLYDEFK
ncbi:antigen WC1.1-like isoform X6 [Pecten maximus]|uniref:antigen WC1.1-like isoform X6 n=1 Tax=Pecten maximus TaxID=6579 RepID=UPI001458CD66|nr:antigen WC1.1-like isoform X6 [Pecten maximus]